MYAYVDASPPWLGEHIQRFIKQHKPETIFVKDLKDIPQDASSVFQYCSGQDLNQHFALLTKVPNGLMNAYPNSDAVARKDHLAVVIDRWSTKRPDSVLGNHCFQTVRLDLDYAEYVEEALMAADDLTLLASLEENADKPPSEREWWILKPALVDCGAGIRLFSTIEELASNLELAEYEVDSDDDDDEDTESDSVSEDDECPETNSEYYLSSAEDEDRVTISDTEQSSRPSSPAPSSSIVSPSSSPTTSIATSSIPISQLSLNNTKPPKSQKKTYTFVENGRIPSAQMRSFVAQRYLTHPSTISHRKWHCRSYVLCLGRLQVFVYREMLALLAGEPYSPPWLNPPLKASLTNTALQDEDTVDSQRSMRNFWTDLTEPEFTEKFKENIFKQICDVSAELFKGAVNTMSDRFVCLEKCFELFALDFLVDQEGTVWLMEVNETPAFYEHPVTGPIALRLFEGVTEIVMGHLDSLDGKGEREERKEVKGMVQVLDERGNLGRSNITEILPEEMYL